jgi:hypothetical protein
VLPVTSGHRLTLTYNLYTARGAGVLSGGQNLSLDRTKLPLSKILHEALASTTFMPDGGTLGIRLHHYYPFANDRLHRAIGRTLKGSDMAVYEALVVSNLRFSLVRHYDANSAGDPDLEDNGYDSDNSAAEYCIGRFSPAAMINDWEEEESREQSIKRTMDKAGARGYKRGEITWLATRAGGDELTHTFLTVRTIYFPYLIMH